MIFVTVGSMLPFERLVKTMDGWAERHPDIDVFCQIGEGAYIPKSMRWARILKGSEFKQMVADSEIVIAHAGTGSVFTAFEARKPILIVPRYADLLEHTTDHQVHTAEWLSEKNGVIVAERNDDFDQKIDTVRSLKLHSDGFSPYAPVEFTSRLRAFIDTALAKT